MTSGPTPRLRELDTVTPTLFADLRRCPLCVAYRVDPQFRELRRLTPAKALGLVTHALTERVARGYFDGLAPADLRDALDSAWREEVTSKHQELSASWRLGAVPPPERWPGYERTRVHVRRSLAQQLTRRMSRQPVQEQRVATVEIEKTLDVPELRLRGRPDRVEINADGIHIIDLKSSWAYGDEIREEHKDQLLLYAILWQRRHGDWPRMASVQIIDGARVSFPIDPTEAEELAGRAYSELMSFNASVDRGGDPIELARPSADACRWCDYKVVCAAFFQALGPDWRWQSRSVLGIVSSVSGVGTERSATITVRASNLEKTDKGQAHILGIPTPVVPLIGQLVAVVDAAAMPTEGDVRALWSTQLAVW